MEAEWAESVYHLYVVRHAKREELKKHLEANKVGCALHYPLPLHLQKCYASLGYKEGSFPVAEKAVRECLSLLTIYPELTEEQIQRVSEVVHDFFQEISPLKNNSRDPRGFSAAGIFFGPEGC